MARGAGAAGRSAGGRLWASKRRLLQPPSCTASGGPDFRGVYSTQRAWALTTTVVFAMVIKSLKLPQCSAYCDLLSCTINPVWFDCASGEHDRCRPYPITPQSPGLMRHISSVRSPWSSSPPCSSFRYLACLTLPSGPHAVECCSEVRMRMLF